MKYKKRRKPATYNGLAAITDLEKLLTQPRADRLSVVYQRVQGWLDCLPAGYKPTVANCVMACAIEPEEAEAALSALVTPAARRRREA